MFRSVYRNENEYRLTYGVDEFYYTYCGTNYYCYVYMNVYERITLADNKGRKTKRKGQINSKNKFRIVRVGNN